MRISLSDPMPLELSPRDVESGPPETDSGAGADSAFAHVLQGIGSELGRGEATTRAAIASMSTGTQGSAAQLIALQAGVYRYSETIDLASRLLDHITGGIKSVLQGSGQ